MSSCQRLRAFASGCSGLQPGAPLGRPTMKLPSCTRSRRRFDASRTKKLEQTFALVAERDDELGQLLLTRRGETDGDCPASDRVELSPDEPGGFAPEHELGDRALSELEPGLELVEARTAAFLTAGLDHQEELVRAWGDSSLPCQKLGSACEVAQRLAEDRGCVVFLLTGAYRSNVPHV